jgi:hypothetical protein
MHSHWLFSDVYREKRKKDTTTALFPLCLLDCSKLIIYEDYQDQLNALIKQYNIVKLK